MDPHMLERRYQDFEAGLVDLAAEVPKSTAPRVEGWNDDKLLQLRGMVTFSDQAHKRGFLRRILVRFYKLYFSGSIAEQDNVVGIVADASALARTSTSPVWPETLYSNNPFYPINGSTIEKLDVPTHGALPTPVEVVPGMSQEEKARYLQLIKTYTDQDAISFKNKIATIIDNIPVEGAASRDELLIRQLTGFLALTLWRSATKNKDQLTNAFLKIQYVKNLNALAEWPIDWGYVPPCSQCLDYVTTMLQKGRPATSSMFILLASQYVLNRKDEASDGATAAILSSTVLTHTARNGLGMIQLLEQAEIATRQKWTQICRLSYTNITSDNWDQIKLFFATYLKKSNLQYGYNWARIINDGYLRDYSPKEMLPLAGVLAGIVEQHQGKGIWEAEWCKGYVEQLDDLKKFGQALYELTKFNLDSTIAAPSAQATLDRARALKPVQPTTQNEAERIRQIQF